MSRHILTGAAQKLRREMASQERHLWYDFLCTLPVRFRRQKVVGGYIVDFYCSDPKLVIELDGGQHYDDGTKQRDAQRDDWLKQQGIVVLRYSNTDIQVKFEGVCADITRYLSR